MQSSYHSGVCIICIINLYIYVSLVFIPNLFNSFHLIFIAAVTFLEYWKRKSVSLAHHWDCIGFQDEIERPRPEFAARAPFLERNPVTGVQEPSFPKSLRNKRIAAGLGIVFLMVPNRFIPTTY